MNMKRGTYAAFVAALGSAAVTDFAVAQEGALLEEVVVTARRYEESITDAPLAVAVMSDDFLEQTQVDSVTDILELTPGASWGMFAKAQPTFTLRGISAGSNGNASLEQAVSVVHDGIPITKVFMATTSVFDVERIEVMRGPQGTTFGRNATLGLMHFISARPSQDSDAGLDLTAGTMEMYGVSGFINGGLTDTISGRLAFNLRDTHQGIEDAVTGDPLEGSENTGIRGSLLIEPNDNFSAYLKAEFNHDEDLPVVRRQLGCDPGWLNAGGFGSYANSPCDPWKADIDMTRTDWNVERDTAVLAAELTWALDNDLTLTWLSGYQTGEHESIQDAFGTPFAIRDQIVRNDADILSSEIRLDNSASGNAIRWLVGASILEDTEDRYEENVQFPERGLPRGLCGPQANVPDGCPEWNLITDATNDTSAYGVFGELQFDLSDRMTLAVGGRYSDDTRDYRFSTYGWGEANGLSALGLGSGARDCNANRIDDPLGRLTSMGAVYQVCGTEANTMGFDDNVTNSWDNFSSKVSLSYALSDNSNIYALYSEGFKAGGFQQDARNSAHLRDNFVDSEDAENIEFGWKGSYDRFRVALTVFQQTQNNLQVNNNVPAGPGSTGNVTLVKNSGGVENTGIEFEYAWAATENLEIGGNIASYDPEFLAGSFQGGMFDPVTGTFDGEDISGTVPSNSPEFTYYLYGDYQWLMNNGGTIRLRADVSHRDQMLQARISSTSVRRSISSALASPGPMPPTISRSASGDVTLTTIRITSTQARASASSLTEVHRILVLPLLSEYANDRSVRQVASSLV
jgi:iron complex outermembrane receptor protein